MVHQLNGGSEKKAMPFGQNLVLRQWNANETEQKTAHSGSEFRGVGSIYDHSWFMRFRSFKRGNAYNKTAISRKDIDRKISWNFNYLFMISLQCCF